MKTIATFSKPEEAHLLRIRLEAAGIPAFLQDEHVIQMDWLYSNLIGGVLVQFADEDLDAARDYLAAESPQPGVVCPMCGSLHTAPNALPKRLGFLDVFAIHFLALFTERRWRCADCRRVFRPGQVR